MKETKLCLRCDKYVEKEWFCNNCGVLKEREKINLYEYFSKDYKWISEDKDTVLTNGTSSILNRQLCRAILTI